METKDLEKEPVEQLKLKVGARRACGGVLGRRTASGATKMKHPDTGEWIHAVIYHKTSESDILWCRSVESFKSHFSDAKVEGDEVYL